VVTDTGDMGSPKRPMYASTQSGSCFRWSRKSSFGGYDPSRGFAAVSTGTANATDTGDLGSEAANNAATAIWCGFSRARNF
jgi:hypothetical protein